jgi:hypothetical protein
MRELLKISAGNLSWGGPVSLIVSDDADLWEEETI